MLETSALFLALGEQGPFEVEQRKGEEGDDNRLQLSVNSTGVRFGGVIDKFIIEGHVCELSIDFFHNEKHLYCALLIM